MRFMIFHQEGSIGYYLVMTAFVISCITALIFLLGRFGGIIGQAIVAIPVVLIGGAILAIPVGIVMAAMISVIMYPASLYRDHIVENMKPPVTTNHVTEAKTRYVVDQAMKDAEKRYHRLTIDDLK